jgi:hypothetical protein
VLLLCDCEDVRCYFQSLLRLDYLEAH